MNDTDAKPENGKLLIALARESIAAGLRRARPAAALPHPLPPWLAAPGASFVTLMLDRELRGCIGSLMPRLALHEDVMHNARAAAFEDPRFAPLTPAEFPRMKIEVSVLSPLTAIPARDEAGALGLLRPGVDGVVLEQGSRRATFLPQVWEELPEPAQFLRHLKHKGGWPDDYWSPEMKLSRYTVYQFREEELHDWVWRSPAGPSPSARH